nr:zinc finger, CCHC-type [Tanacetum cinerariifolium]
AIVRLLDPKRKTLGEKGIDYIFVGYAEHSKAYRQKNIIPYSVESQRDDHSGDVPSETPKSRKGKRVRKAKSYGSDFQLYLIEGLKDQVGSQYSYCYSIKEDPRAYNEAMQSRDAAFWKEAIGDEIGSIMENNTWVLSDLPPRCKPLAIHNLVIHQMDVKTTFLNGNLDEEVYMKQPKGFVMPSNEHKKLIQMLVGYIMLKIHLLQVDGCFYLGGCAISWASKKQTCITSSTMESEFVALAVGGKEVEWLRNLIHEIPIWPKQAYSQIYNGKSRHLGARLKGPPM